MALSRIVTIASLTLLLSAARVGATPILAYSGADGSTYTLDASNVGNLYTFTFSADFTGVTSSAALGDYAMLISFKGVGATWSTATSVISTAPGSESNWRIIQNDSNSNGCKLNHPSTSEWCIELVRDGIQDGPLIATGSLLTWTHTMNLATGTPNFLTPWPFKFTTTTGAFDWRSNTLEWVYGGYQVSQELVPLTAVPEPASMLLLGTGLAGLALNRRRRKTRV